MTTIIVSVHSNFVNFSKYYSQENLKILSYLVAQCIQKQSVKSTNILVFYFDKAIKTSAQAESKNMGIFSVESKI